MSAVVRTAPSPIEVEAQGLAYRDRVAKALGRGRTSWDDGIAAALAEHRMGILDEAETMKRIEEQKARAKAYRAMKRGR